MCAAGVRLGFPTVSLRPAGSLSPRASISSCSGERRVSCRVDIAARSGRRGCHEIRITRSPCRSSPGPWRPSREGNAPLQREGPHGVESSQGQHLVGGGGWDDRGQERTQKAGQQPAEQQGPAITTRERQQGNRAVDTQHDSSLQHH